MEVTEVRIFPAAGERFRAYVTVTLDHCFVITDLKIIRGPRGHFVDMPYRIGRDGQRREIVSMISTDARNMLEEKVFAEYKKITGESLTTRKLS
jgi:stage V sporulation protein G